MALAAFDTHTFVKRLTKVGMPIEQAEVLSEEQARLINDRLATKEDLALLGKDLRREISDLRKDMDAKFVGIDAKFERLNEKLDKMLLQLTVRLSGVIVATLTVLSLLPKIFH